MRTLQRFATVCFLGAAAAALIPACSSTDPATPGGGAGAGHAGSGAAGSGAAGSGAGAAGAHAGAGNAGAPTGSAGAAGGGTLVGDATRGQIAYRTTNAGCNSCHGEMGEGGLGPNITGSTTGGIGMWTETQFHDAVRLGKNKSGGMLCSAMTRATAENVSDQAVADIFAWLLSVKGQDTKVTGTFCASCGCTGG